MSTRRRLPPEQRERQVLDAAARVFARSGFHDASMDAVADEAGVSKPMVYTHGGGSKEELFARCIRREAERLLTSVSGGIGSPDPETRLYRGLRAFFTTVTTHREGWMVLYRQARAGTFAGEVFSARSRIVTRVAELLADSSVDPAAAMPVASTLVGAAEGLADWYFDGGTGTPDDLAAQLMSVVWPGLAALRAGHAWSPTDVGTERVTDS
ncbi:TetR/AcrR family transcriptional regulator [Pseudonocardia sp. KRD291]|uniref:TetR/AcrR family transcriptional regulator n=1 Tax=Pseudonocardia sp. KRD291 TaxID=2792007 RepID=UPI001C4A3621|nr:TetR/AcrR family transcriptional regulator [Pseudonocardia sp. KRD291]MBW0103100.1 TetR/AcrR family transcriptional regulator [Pseudonocardia sp. KRD291]